jgi:outer membrane biosynthesis protein TonB
VRSKTLVALLFVLVTACASTGPQDSTTPRISELPDPVRCKAETPPIRISGRAPAMPQDAKKALKQTEVLLEALVRTDGTVQVLRVLQAPDPDFGLRDMSLQSVSQWIYRPALRAGQPVNCTLTIKLPFPPPPL